MLNTGKYDMAAVPVCLLSFSFLAVINLWGTTPSSALLPLISVLAEPWETLLFANFQMSFFMFTQFLFDCLFVYLFLLSYERFKHNSFKPSGILMLISVGCISKAQWMRIAPHFLKDAKHLHRHCHIVSLQRINTWFLSRAQMSIFLWIYDQKSNVII